MPLTLLAFTPANIKTGIDVVRQMKSLNRVGLKAQSLLSAEEFWTKYDAGEFDGR